MTLAGASSSSRRAETEIADLKVEKEASAVELAEARAELVEVHAAHETEMQKRTEAEARVVRLKAAIATIRDECDAIDDQEEPAPGENATGPVDVEPIAPDAEKLAEHLGLTEADLTAVDLLVRRGDAPDRTTMLAALVRCGLAVGALPVDARLRNDRDHGEGQPAARR